MLCAATQSNNEMKNEFVLAAEPEQSGMVGRTYLERGRPVVVLARWGPGGGPRNVLIRREDGTMTVRPFRGLRRPRGRTSGSAS